MGDLDLTTICIFLPTGRTFTFRNAAIRLNNETELVIDYTAMSDGLLKTATLQKNHIVGWALTQLAQPLGEDV